MNQIKMTSNKHFDPIYYFTLISTLPNENFGDSFFEMMSKHCKEPGAFELLVGQWPHSSVDDVVKWFIQCSSGTGAFAQFAQTPKERMLKLMKMLQLYWSKYHQVPKDHWQKQQHLWLENKFGKLDGESDFLKKVMAISEYNSSHEKQLWREHSKKK